MPHFIAISGLIIFSVLGMGSVATGPRVAPAPADPGVVIDAPLAPVPTFIPLEDIGRNARVSRAPWSAHTIIPSKSYTVVGAVVVRTTDGRTVLGDLMERAIALGGHDIKNVIITQTITDEGAPVTSAIAVAIRYTNETLRLRVDSAPVIRRVIEGYVGLVE